MASQTQLKKILIIRLSSFGDILQCTPAAELLRTQAPDCEIHWVVRQDSQQLLSSQPWLTKLWVLDRKQGLRGLVSLARLLSLERFSHVYDAHNNLRSHLLQVAMFFFGLRTLFSGPKWLRRSKERWRRFLLFTFSLPTLPKPYRGSQSYLEPLQKWGVALSSSLAPAYRPDPVALKSIAGHNLAKDSKVWALAPSAAWPMKRWPVEHFKKLILLLPEHRFVVLGGPQDLFCEELRATAPERVQNFAGQLSLAESLALITQCQGLISADTGLMHGADQMGVRVLALIGPTAFGFPYFKNSTVLDVELDCRPCTKDGRGRCSQKVYQKCMVDITPERVAQEVLRQEQQHFPIFEKT